MRALKQARRRLRQIVLGPDNLMQYVVGMRDPQNEIGVWLCGAREPRDVTSRHMMACGAPFTIGVGFHSEEVPPEHTGLRLEFRARRNNRLLGSIDLSASSHIPLEGGRLQLYTVRRCRNRCFPTWRLFARSIFASYERRRHPAPIPMSKTEAEAMAMFYVCPRPVALVTVSDGPAGNIFPMDLMGPIGCRRFAFGLTSTTPVTALVERARRIALSNIPLEEEALAFSLGSNHKKDRVAFQDFPFLSRTTQTFHLPAPSFAQRVREMSIEAVQNIGSHTLFVARIDTDERWDKRTELFVAHANYRAWKRSTGELLLPNFQSSSSSAT